MQGEAERDTGSLNEERSVLRGERAELVVEERLAAIDADRDDLGGLSGTLIGDEAEEHFDVETGDPPEPAVCRIISFEDK